MTIVRAQSEQSKSEPAMVGAQKRRASEPAIVPRPLTLNTAHSPALRLGHQLGSSRGVQAKLTVNQPGDEFEQEADRVAEQVMRMPDTSLRVQRKCGCGGSCESCAEEPLKLQRQSATAGMVVDVTAPPAVHDVLRSPGQALDENTRSFFEGRFRQDFSGVRIHNDEPASASAREINARAYTVGQDIVFAPGQYAPGTAAGTHLLAHELTHVIQQAPGVHRQSEIIPAGPLQTSSAAAREAALRYQPTMRPHVPTAPRISPPPTILPETTAPATCPPAATVQTELRSSDLGSRTETQMQHDINLARSRSSLSLPASTSLITQTDRAIRAVFGSLLPTGRNFAAPTSVTMRTPDQFADLRIPTDDAARRRISEVALEVGGQQLADLCINDATNAVLQREIVNPLFGRVGRNFVKEYERGRIGGQTTYPVVSGRVQPHVDLPSQSRNIGHIIVHEAMHFYVSEAYQDTAEADPLTRQLMEGGAEFLARNVINDRLASDANFRINTGTYADEFSYVATYLMRGGISSFSLAYFQGRVDLLGLPRPAVQPKLMVGQQNEPSEIEADRMADWVMSQSGSQRSHSNTSLGAAPSTIDDVLRSPGQPMDVATRAFMEPRFGRDLSHVRLHTDTQAAESAQAVNARAYAVGPHLVFNSQQYDTVSTEGKRLLAHELTHVVQNSGSAPAILQRDSPRPQSPAPVDVPFTSLPDGQVVSDPTGRTHGIRIERWGAELFYFLPGGSIPRQVVRPRPRGPRGALLPRVDIVTVTWNGNRSFQDAFTATFTGVLADSFTVNIHGFGRFSSLASAIAEEDVPLEVHPEGLEVERRTGILSQSRPRAGRFRDAQRYHAPGATFSLYVMPNRDVMVADDATGRRLWMTRATELDDLQISPNGGVRAVFHDSGGSAVVSFSLADRTFGANALGYETPSPERAALLADLRRMNVVVTERGARFTLEELRAARQVVGGWRGSVPLQQAALFGLRLIKDVSAGSPFYHLGEVHIPGTEVENPSMQRGTIIHELTHALFSAARLESRQGGGFPQHVLNEAAQLEAVSAVGGIDEGAVEHHPVPAARRRPVQRGGRNQGWAERLSSSPVLNEIWNHLHNRFDISDPEGTGDIRGLDVADESRHLQSQRGDVVGHGFDNVTEFIASFVTSTLEHQAAMSDTVLRSRSTELAGLYQDLWTWVNANLVLLGSVNPYDAVLQQQRAVASRAAASRAAVPRP